MWLKNNTAKQYILAYLASNEIAEVLDFACGTASPWYEFLIDHSEFRYFGFDFNEDAIAVARDKLSGDNIDIRIADGQKTVSGMFGRQFEAVTTFSSIEHVVGRREFIKNMIDACKPGGTIIINYDSGHFRSGRLMESIFNAFSRLFAVFGVEKYYTQYVSEKEICAILQEMDVEVMEKKYFNLLNLKELHKRINDDQSLCGWFDYELLLNEYDDKEYLEKLFTSTVIICRKCTS